MGGSTSGKRVNERTAMQMTAVYSCVRILSEAVAGLPLQFYRYTKDGGKEKAVDHPLYFLLHDEPNPEMTSFVFRETLMTHLLLWGNAYSQIIRNARGEIIALYPLMPDRMTVNRDENGQLYYEYYMNTEDAHTMKGITVRLQPHDVLHIPGLGFDGLVGYSPIAMAKYAIGMAIACEEYGAKFFANGAAPSDVLEHPGTIKDPSRVRESWQSTFGGSANADLKNLQIFFIPLKTAFKSPYSEEVAQMVDEQKNNHITTENGKTSVSVSEKYMLTIKEAAEYFSIGTKKMRRLAEDNLGRFAVYSGNRYLIIRTKFEKFVDESSVI